MVIGPIRKVNTGSGNTGLGAYALYQTNADGNTALGDSAGWTNAHGTGNTYIGYQANNITPATIDNATAIGNGAEVCSSNSMMFGNSSVTQWNFGMSCPVTCTGGPGVINVNVGGGSAVYMSSGGVWNMCSDRNKKTNFTAINKDEILNKVVLMPVTRWNYKSEDVKIQHIGPMAQDFYKAFQLNNDSLHITSIDEAGVAFAAIQALNQKLEAENTALKAQLTEITKNEDARFTNDEKQIAELKAMLNPTGQAQASIK